MAECAWQAQFIFSQPRDKGPADRKMAAAQFLLLLKYHILYGTKIFLLKGMIDTLLLNVGIVIWAIWWKSEILEEARMWHQRPNVKILMFYWDFTYLFNIFIFFSTLIQKFNLMDDFILYLNKVNPPLVSFWSVNFFQYFRI